MRILTFGWEFPPHISGGLGTACYGLTKALLDEKTTVLFVVPHKFGDEGIELISASETVLQVSQESESISKSERTQKDKDSFVKLRIPSSLKPYTQRGFEVDSHRYQNWNYEFMFDKTKVVKVKEGVRYAFTGSYGPALLDEVQRYGEVAVEIARQHSFDVIHAHDWLTYPAGIEAKKISGKPLVVHVHATEFDRSGENEVDSRVMEIERKGLIAADKVIAVSQWTKDIIVSKYNISEEKVSVVHNGIIPNERADFSRLPKISDHIVTFLGRITYQKGPQYFIEAACKVLQIFPDAHFIMAGSGDLLPKMIELVAQLKLSARFHFTGFLKGKQIPQVWSVSDVFVMPSVSEPFGITPLEAAQAEVPVIISNQSGVAEVMDHAIKVDFWDTDALADAIINVLRYKSLSNSLKTNGKKELETLTWKRAAKKINNLYCEIY